jgi:hypothetical protein
MVINIEIIDNELTNWLIVGCNQPVVMALMVAIASNPPAAPRLCPIKDCIQKRNKKKHIEANMH